MLLYFFPDVTVPGEVCLEGTALGREGLVLVPVFEGPGDSGRGMLAGVGAGTLEYVPTAQTWRKCAGGKFWIGWRERPRPHELALPEQIPGYPVVLLDGHEWRVPLARPFAGGTRLPEVMTLDDDGEPVRMVADRYRELKQIADGLFDSWLADLSGFALPQAQAEQWAVEALGANYRIGRYEAAALELLDTHRIGEVLRALVDGPAVERMLAELSEKKTESGA